ncbi:MAG TPA: PaaI family thioesterase [Geminicoccaceae bacterium]|nr:PaaI family thioesterase [Geminicoccaceae bacterium]
MSPPPPDYADAVDAFIERARRGELGSVTGPFEELIGYRARFDDRHGLYLELDVARQHLSHYGVAHGGVALLLLDTIGGVAVFFQDRALGRITTISLATNFVRAVEVGRVVASARVDQLGRSVAHVSMALRAGSPDGELLATGLAAYRLFRQPPQGGS